MSRRYALFAAKEKIEEIFEVHCPDAGLFEPNFNMGPGGTAPVVLLGKARAKKVALLRWGLSGSDLQAQNGDPMVTTPVSTLSDDVHVKRVFQRQRCIVPVSGFYEWQKMGKLSIPYYIRTLDQEVMGLAAIYEKGGDGSDGGSGFSLITTESNDLIRPLHEQMPVILRRRDFNDWLDPLYEDMSRLHGMLKAYPTERMSLYRVGDAVSDGSTNGPDLVRPVV